ncbi:MAG: S-methyl-5'-thioadenosine phosphorylase [Fidelibacterota bacterium]
MAERRIGIIGGSGLYEIDELENVQPVSIETPFGKPSDDFIIGNLGGEELVFLPRHGVGHRLIPTEINYRANIYGMKKLGVEWIISATAVGSFKEELKPRDIVVVDQFFDRTNSGRKTTFFGEGLAAHISFAHPVCPRLTQALYEAAKACGVNVHMGGPYVNMEGPAFSTKAESFLFKSWGMDVIGMTNLAEARLAREAEICYATMALVTDYDCWREQYEEVSVEILIDNLMANAVNAKSIIREMVPRIPKKRDCKCASALKNAFITERDMIPDTVKDKLSLIIGKYIR